MFFFVTFAVTLASVTKLSSFFFVTFALSRMYLRHFLQRLPVFSPLLSLIPGCYFGIAFQFLSSVLLFIPG